MLDSGKEYYTRFSPADVTQISFSFAPTPISNQEIKLLPTDEKLHKKYRKKWKFFSRILLRKFTVKFSKELYRVSLTVIQLRNYYMKCRLKKWYYRFKWSRMVHRIYRINYIQQIKTRALSLKEKKKKKSPNQLKWKTISRLLITSELRSRLYSELNLLIKERRMIQIAKWKELCLKLRPINLQNIQKSFKEKRHNKYIYRRFFILWLLKYRNQGDSIKYIFKVEYPEMALLTHINIPFEFDSYSIPFTQTSISKDISLLKDVYDFSEILQNLELEDLPDLFIPELNDNSSLAKHSINNLYSPVSLYSQIKIPEIVINSIYDDFNDMQSHLFSKDEQLNLSVSSSLSYFQSCPQFQLKDNAEADISLSMNDFSKEDLSSLKNYQERKKPNKEPSNIDMNVPLHLSNISGSCARSLSQFTIKPTIKEQKTQVNFDFGLDEIKGHIGSSSLTNFKHYINKKHVPTIEPDVPLSFRSISDQDASKKAFSNYQRIEIKAQSSQIGNIYKNFNDFEKSVVLSEKTKSLDGYLINDIDSKDNLFYNLQDYENVTLPKSGNADDITVDIVFIDEVLPLQSGISGVSSIELFELPQSTNKELNKAESITNSKSIDDIGKKEILNSDDDVSISIELELSEEIPSLSQNLEKVKSFELIQTKNKKSKNTDHILNSSTVEEIVPFSGIDNSSIENININQNINHISNVKFNSIDTNRIQKRFTIHQFNPNLIDLTKRLSNYKYKCKENDLNILDEKDLSLAPNYSFLLKQPEVTLQQMNNTGPTLKLLFKTTEEEEAIFEEEEEEFDDVNLDSIDFNCLSPLYLDIPSDIVNSISRNANSLDSTCLTYHGANNSGILFDSSLSYSNLIEKSRYIPYIFQIPSKIFSPLYLYQKDKQELHYDSTESVIRNIAKNPSTLMSKTRYTPSFLDMYPLMIDNIIRLTYNDRSSLVETDYNYDIHPKIIHTCHFLSNVKSSFMPFNTYQKKIKIAKPQEELAFAGFQLPKVRYTPHIFTYISTTLNTLCSYHCKQKHFLSLTKRSFVVSKENDQFQKKKIKKRAIIRKTKKTSNKRNNNNNNNNTNVFDTENDLTINQVTSKRTIKETVNKTVFVPIKIDDFDENEYEQEQEQIETVNEVISKSTHNSLHKTKVNSKRSKRRAASAKNKIQRLQGDSILTFRKIIIDADETCDDENAENQSNINVAIIQENDKPKKLRKKKRRGCSVSYENSSPKKSNPK
ncbi:hypothetical protein M9Y10_022641 [Tritrichomonas musculus]|uniref:IQ calmodulin-binding motif family protein n=1 Tax=Tritrichomonas musculus TaxID=1915356 RepID=A0ABR2KT25_9EUKA